MGLFDANIPSYYYSPTPKLATNHATPLVIALALVGSLALCSLTSHASEPSALAVDNWLRVEQLNDLEKRLFVDSDDDHFENYNLLDAALVASGVNEPADLKRYVAKASDQAEKLRLQSAAVDSPKAKAALVFDYLHSQILKGGYALECTDLRETLDRGRFNCVSATVLFNYLARQLGLVASALQSPGHAMSRVTYDGITLDIETTCPRWFRWIEQPPERRERIEKSLGPGYQEHEPGRPVGDRALVAMIYYNRGVDLLADGHFEEAIAANAKALRLDPSNKTVRGNFLAAINNWAIALASTKQYSEAADLLQRGLATDPGYRPFQLNYEHVRRDWSAALANGERIENADLRASEDAQ